MGCPSCSRVEKLEPNSVVSSHLGQVHQKCLVCWRWSLRAIVPHSACVYMVDMCSPAAMFLPARTVILKSLSNESLTLGWQLCSMRQAMA